MFIIDRFEEDWAVIEYDKKTFNIPKELLPVEACEGDVLKIVISIKKADVEERKERIGDLMDDLFDS